MDSVITDDWEDDNSYVCNCSKSAFCDPHYGHIVTGNMKVIENINLCVLDQDIEKRKKLDDRLS